MKIRLPTLLGLFAMLLLAVSAARAQSANFVTIAGTTGSPGFADGTNGAAQFYWPEGIAEDTQSNLYVADSYENTVRKITPNGTNWVVTTIAGTAGNSTGDADATNGAAGFDSPVGVAVDTNGNLYVGEYSGSTIRKITPMGTNWVVTTIAGQPRTYNYANGTNGGAQFNGFLDLALDPQGNLYVADTYNSVIRKLTPVGTNWVVTTIAGQPLQTGYADGTNGDATFGYPYGLACDRAGNLYVSDDDGLLFGGATIRKLTPVGTNWVVTTIAGSPTASGYTDASNSAALFNSPLGLAVDSAGGVYVADSGNHVLRKLTPVGTNWVASTITGTNATFAKPYDAAVDSAGNLFVTDYGNATVLLGNVGLPVVSVPALAIGSAADRVMVSWPATGSFTLQTNADLTTTNWGNYGGTINTGGGTSSAALAPMPGNLFFRLAH